MMSVEYRVKFGRHSYLRTASDVLEESDSQNIHRSPQIYVLCIHVFINLCFYFHVCFFSGAKAVLHGKSKTAGASFLQSKPNNLH